MTYLIYIGTSFLAGVPARDLTREEAEQFGVKELLKSGLYKLAEEKKNPDPNKGKKGDS